MNSEYSNSKPIKLSKSLKIILCHIIKPDIGQFSNFASKKGGMHSFTIGCHDKNQAQDKQSLHVWMLYTKTLITWKFHFVSENSFDKA